MGPCQIIKTIDLGPGGGMMLEAPPAGPAPAPAVTFCQDAD